MATSKGDHAVDEHGPTTSTKAKVCKSVDKKKVKKRVVSSVLKTGNGKHARKATRTKRRRTTVSKFGKTNTTPKRLEDVGLEKLTLSPPKITESVHKTKKALKKHKNSKFKGVISELNTIVKPKQGQIHAKVVAGASLVKHKPLFSFDSRYLFVITNNIVRVYSTATAECVHTLCAHSTDVVSICISPRNHLQLISCSEDGKVVFWDYSDGIYHKEMQLGLPIHKAFFPTSDAPFYVVSGKNQLLQIQSFGQPVSEWEVVFRMCHPDCVVLGFQGLFAARVHKNHIDVVFLDDIKKHYSQTDHFSQRFTCIAGHPSDFCIATGDIIGRIHVWYNLRSEKFSRTVLHWHQLPIADLVFTYAGSNLISGGGECAIVKWKIDSDTRAYVPRLGMPICRIAASPDNILIASCHVDNAIHLLSNTGHIVQVIQGLTQGHQWKEFDVPPIPTGILYDPKTRAIVLNGKPGHLQFYSIQEDKQLFNLDITGFNYQHSERTFKVTPTDVTKAAFDSKGNWLVTVERRDDGVTSADMRLKFWQYNSQKQNFVLNTSVEHAHLSEIITVKFQPDTTDGDHIPLAITCGLDKRFKIWTVSDDSDIYKKQQSWNCDSVGYFRDLVPGPVSFCEDGTVVAITFTNIVTLWLPESNVLKATLTPPLDQEKIQQVEFGSENSSHLLVCSTQTHLRVWNVLSLTVQWSINMSVCALAKDCFSERMAVITEENKLFVFNPLEPRPILAEEIATSSPVICAAFLPQHENHVQTSQTKVLMHTTSTLYFMNADQILFQVSDVKPEEPEDQLNNVVMQHNVPVTPFATFLGNQVKKIETDSSKMLSNSVSEQSDLLSELIMAPSNTLPPIKVLCASLLGKVFLLPKEKVKQKQKKEEKAREDSESDESDREQTPTFKETVKCTQLTKSEETDKLEESVKRAAERSFSWLREVWQSCS